MIGRPDESVPQRLKPEIRCGGYGMAEAVPVSETRRAIVNGVGGDG